MDDNVYNHITSETHAWTLWENTASLYASKCGNNKLFLLNSIVNLKFKENASLSYHLNEFQGIFLSNFEDEILGLILLNSLLESWETFKVSFTNSAPNDVCLSLKIGREVRKREEKRAKISLSPGTRMWTVIKQDIYRSIISCGKKRTKEKMDHDDDDDHFTIAIGDDLVILQDFESVNLVSNESMWIIHSSTTFHVTPRKEFFTSYTSSDFGVLKMGNDGLSKVIGVSDVCLQTNIGVQLWLKRVKHALDVRFNLIFMHGDYDNHFVSFKKHPPLRKSELLELMHFNVKSFSGTLYFVTFIDDYFRKLWVYTLKTKDQVLEKFKQFQALVERQLGKKVKCIHFDNGGEYCGTFDGIKHENNPPKTPQLNGLVERMNRTSIERGEAFYTVVHVINLSLAVALNTKVFVHVPKDERSKLDMKTSKCIFIGYGQDKYGYGLYDPVEKKFVRSRDVQFMEDQTVEDINKVKKTTLEKDNSLSEIDLVQMLVHDLDTIENNVQNGEQHDYVDENLGDAPKPPLVQLRKSNRQRQSSTRYPSDEYVILTDGEELECYQEAMESEERQKWLDAMQDEIKSLHDNHTYDLVKLPKGKK
ncbi:hypothetical protein CR513_40372, partial [Mucuna pruriens]